MPVPPQHPPLRATPAQDAATHRWRFGLSRLAWLAIAGAFVLGLLLFALLWIDQRNGDRFYRVDGPSATGAAQRFDPLPAPLPASSAVDNASGTQQRDDAMQGPQTVEAPTVPPPALPSTQAPDASAVAAMAPVAPPVPIESPAPRYPPAALRRGESGSVVLRVHVGVDGVPYDVDIVDSSRSRLLDRAAIDAVRRWRFRPAQRDGQAVIGQVQVPISFDPGG